MEKTIRIQSVHNNTICLYYVVPLIIELIINNKIKGSTY